MTEKELRSSQAADLRKRAEEIALEKAAWSRQHVETLSPDKTRLTLHELRVHQIELEMQNEELRRAQVELEASRARYFELYDLAPVGYCTLSEPGLILEANLTAASLLGVARGDMVKQPFPRFILNEDQDIYYLHRKNLFETGAPQAYELRMMKKDSTEFWARLEATAAQDADGAPICLLVISDVTDRKVADAQLCEAKTAADRANQAKDHFLARLSHELRTPLAPVLMVASALKGDSSVPEWLREEMDTICRSVDLEVRLIDDLLDLTRIASGKMAFRLEELDVHAEIVSAVEICGLDVREAGLVIETDMSAEHRHINGDAGRVRQILWNLLKNAIKFSSKGGHIKMRSFNRGKDILCIEVADTGRGIAADALPRLFDAFEQGGREITRQFGGLGLGLAISKAMVEMHGGRITVASDGPGKGATFTVELPTINTPQAVRPEPVSRAPNAGRRLRILIVEDDPSTRWVLQRYLERAGHSVETATTMMDGMKAAESNRPDLLISDLGLPDGDGVDLMRRLRVVHPDLPGIALSGLGMESDIERSKQAGFTEHLIKPVTLARLAEAIALAAAGSDAAPVPGVVP